MLQNLSFLSPQTERRKSIKKYAKLTKLSLKGFKKMMNKKILCLLFQRRTNYNWKNPTACVDNDDKKKTLRWWKKNIEKKWEKYFLTIGIWQDEICLLLYDFRFLLDFTFFNNAAHGSIKNELNAWQLRAQDNQKEKKEEITWIFSPDEK